MKLWERIHPGNRYRFLITDDSDAVYYIIVINGSYDVGFDNISEVVSISKQKTYSNITINNKNFVLLEENFSSVEELKSKPELFI